MGGRAGPGRAVPQNKSATEAAGGGSAGRGGALASRRKGNLGAAVRALSVCPRPANDLALTPCAPPRPAPRAAGPASSGRLKGLRRPSGPPRTPPRPAPSCPVFRVNGVPGGAGRAARAHLRATSLARLSHECPPLPRTVAYSLSLRAPWRIPRHPRTCKQRENRGSERRGHGMGHAGCAEGGAGARGPARCPGGFANSGAETDGGAQRGTARHS